MQASMHQPILVLCFVRGRMHLPHMQLLDTFLLHTHCLYKQLRPSRMQQTDAEERQNMPSSRTCPRTFQVTTLLSAGIRVLLRQECKMKPNPRW